MMRFRFIARRRLVRLAILGITVSIVGMGSVGCDGRPAVPSVPSRPFPGLKLVVGIVGDPAILASIKAQKGEWAARTGADLVVRDQMIDPTAVGDVDVLIFPGDRMGDLVASKALAVLPDSVVLPREMTSDGSDVAPDLAPDVLKIKDIVPAYRDLVARYGADRMGLPIGGSALVVAFRRSAFDSPANREAAKAAGLTLEPPKTWDQFDALAKFFHDRDWDGDGAPESGVAIAWGSDSEGVGDSILLARVASLGLHRDQFSFLFDSETTEPRVTSPPFVEGLRAIAALKYFGPPGSEGFDADAARKAFRSGEVALLIDRAERAGTWGSEGSPIGVSPLPGSNRVFDPDRNTWENLKVPNRPSYLPHGGGWLVGVVAKSERKVAAEDYAKYLAGPDSTNRLRAERDFPMLPVRSTQLAQGMASARSAPGVEPRTWADAVTRTLNADRVVPGLRIPGAIEYLADLSRARVAAVGGRIPERVLADLAKQWSDRTKALGLARQTWHHRRSLNGLVTSPEPPPEHR